MKAKITRHCRMMSHYVLKDRFFLTYKGRSVSFYDWEPSCELSSKNPYRSLLVMRWRVMRWANGHLHFSKDCQGNHIAYLSGGSIDPYNMLEFVFGDWCGEDAKQWLKEALVTLGRKASARRGTIGEDFECLERTGTSGHQR